MSSNPCCCCSSLQSGVKAIAIFSMIKAIALAIYNIVLLVFFIVGINSHDPRLQVPTNAATAVILAGIFTIIIRLVSLGLGILLLKAAQNRNEKHSKIWLIITGVLWILTLFHVFWEVSSGDRATTAVLIVHLILEVYFMWVVVTFRNEILEQDAQGFVVSGGMTNEPGPSASYTVNPS